MTASPRPCFTENWTPVIEHGEDKESGIRTLGCFTVVWWIGEVEESFIHIVARVPFVEETRVNEFQPNPNRFRGPAI